MAKKKTSGSSQVIEIQAVTRGRAKFVIKGTSPLICNAMSSKAAQELLMPKPAGKARRTGLKHNPMQEFKDSMYVDDEADSPTLVTGLSAWFKAAMVEATVDMPDASKAAVGRNIWVDGERVHVYGIPRLFMSIVRSAGMNKTPDVRTRAILPEWCCEITTSFAQPQIAPEAVMKLLGTAGIVMGVGDWRPQKGSGNYGQFEVVEESDSTVQRLMKDAGRQQQVAALENPVAHDDETRKLLQWFEEELRARDLKIA